MVTIQRADGRSQFSTEATPSGAPTPHASAGGATRPDGYQYDSPQQAAARVTNSDGYQALPPEPTLAGRTDQAYVEYQAASDSQDANRIAVAKQHLDAAVALEIGTKVDSATAGISPTTPQPATSGLIDSYGKVILQRHADDPGASSVLGASVGDYSAHRQAGALIAAAAEDPSRTSHDRLSVLSTSLQGQPQAVVTAVRTNALVKQWAIGVAENINAPYSTIAPESRASSPQVAEEVCNRLLAGTSGLSPELAALVTEKSAMAISNVASLRGHPEEQAKYFGVIAQVIKGFGQSDYGKTVTTESASAYVSAAYANESAGSGNPQAYQGDWAQNFAQRDGAADRANVFATDLAFTKAIASAAGNISSSSASDAILDQAAIDINDVMVYGTSRGFVEAHAATQTANATLADQLRQCGPLTDAQTQAFIRAFREDPANAAIYARETEEAGKFGSSLKSDSEALLFSAARNPESARKLHEMLGAMLLADQGSVAMDLAGALQDDAAALTAMDAQFPGFVDDFTSDAIAATYAGLLKESGGDTEAATEKLFARMEQSFKRRDGMDAIKEGFRELSSHPSTNLLDSSRMANEFASLDKGRRGFSRGLALVAVMVCAVNGVTGENVVDQIGSMSTAAGTGATLVAKSFTSEGLAVKAMQRLSTTLNFSGNIAEAAPNVARFAAKVVPGLNIIANSASFITDLQRLKETQDPAYAGAVAGDMMAMAGAAFMATPPGAILFGIGMVISVVCNMIGDHNQDAATAQQMLDQRRSCLQAAGITEEPLLTAMATSDPEQVQQLMQLGFTAQEVQVLAARYPPLLGRGGDGAPSLDAVPAILRQSGMDKDAFMSLLMAADASAENPGDGIATIFMLFGSQTGPVFATSSSRQDMAYAMSTYSERHASSLLPTERNAISGAIQWLATHP